MQQDDDLIATAPPDEPPPAPRRRRRRRESAVLAILPLMAVAAFAACYMANVRLRAATDATEPPRMDPDVRAVTDRLQDLDASVRAIADKLYDPDADVRAIADKLYDLDADVRIEACRQLAATGERALPVAPELVEMLRHRTSSEVDAAADALAAVGEPVIPALVDIMDHDSSLAPNAALALARVGEAGVAKLLQATVDPADDTGWVRHAAIAALARAGRMAVPGLAAAVRSAGPTALYATEALEAMGPSAADATYALVSAVRDPSSECGDYAALALCAIGTPEATAELAAFLGDSAPKVAGRDAWALARRRRVPAAMVSGLVGLLRRAGDPAVRGNAAIALGGADANAGEAISALRAALAGDEALSVRIRAALALACLGCTDRRVVMLAEALSPDPKIKGETRAVEVALMCLRAGSGGLPLDDLASAHGAAYITSGKPEELGLPEATTKTIYTVVRRWATSDPDAFIAALADSADVNQAMMLLAWYGRSSVPLMAHFAAVGPAKISDAAAQGIDVWLNDSGGATTAWLDSPDGRTALAALPIEQRTRLRQSRGGELSFRREVDADTLLLCRDTLANPDPSEADRLAAADVLTQAGESGAVQSVLLGLLASDDPGIRENAGSVLAQLGKPIVPVLAEHLDRAATLDERQATIRALGKLRRYAGPVIPKLIALCSDPDPGVRGEAALALSWIRDPERTIAPVIARALVDEDLVEAAKLNGATSDFGPEAAEVWVRMSRSGSSRDRQAAAKALSAYTGRVTAAMEPVLPKALPGRGH